MLKSLNIGLKHSEHNECHAAFQDELPEKKWKKRDLEGRDRETKWRGIDRNTWFDR